MTDHELNERLALALGWKRAPRFNWIAPGYRPLPINYTDMPDFLSGEGMLAVLEALRGQDAVWEMVVSDESHVKLFLPRPTGAKSAQVRADTLPRAVAEAALRALESENGQPA